MRHLFGSVCLLVSGLGLSGCCTQMPAEPSLDPRAAGDFILYRLDGDRYPGEPVPEGGELLHGWLVLEACPIEDVATRNRIFRAFDDGIEDSPDLLIDCFRPRHAISVIGSDGIRMDWLICFQCSNWYSYENQTQVGGGATSDAPAAVLDTILANCPERTASDDQ